MNKRISLLFLVTLVIANIFTTAQENDKNIATIDQANDNEECPFPLISLKSTGSKETENSLCFNGCCLSCPIMNNFYKENEIDLIYNILSIIRLMSFVSVLIVVVSYIVLPSKRERSAITVLWFNISILCFIGVTFFYIGNLRKIQCANSITQATMKNNTLCGVQGVVLIFSTFLCILWCFYLILQLHFQTVWKSNIIQRYHTMSYLLVVIVSATFTILPAVMNEISFEFGAVCMVTSEFANELFWYPLAIFVIPGFLIHFWTFIHIGKYQFAMSKRNNSSKANVAGQDLVKAIKIQWRALTLAFIYVITFIIYWTYVMVELLPNNFTKPGPWFYTWFNCIVENGMKSVDAQNICSIHANDHIPNIAYLISAEFSTAILGINIFVVFGTSNDLWSEWKLYFTEKFGGSNSDDFKDNV